MKMIMELGIIIGMLIAVNDLIWFYAGRRWERKKKNIVVR